MNNPARIAMGAVSALLFVWMLVLYFRSATIVESNSSGADVSVECGSVVAAGWPWDHSDLASQYSSSLSDHIASGPRSLPTEAFAGIARDCADRRDTYLGTMAVLVGPATLFAAGAFFGGRRRDSALAAPPPGTAAAA